MTDAQILRQIGTNIRAARIAANMTQEGLAELADIHWKTMGYIESGKRDFGVTILTRLALCLGTSGERFWHGVESKRPGGCKSWSKPRHGNAKRERKRDSAVSSSDDGRVPRPYRLKPIAAYREILGLFKIKGGDKDFSLGRR